jgi:multidrug efflux pump subunit AcrB
MIIEKRYRPALNYVLMHPRKTIVIVLSIVLTSTVLFSQIGISFFPKAEKPQFLINIDTPEGSSLALTDSIARDIEQILLRENDIRHIATNIGHGNPRIYYNTIAKDNSSNHAQIYVELHLYKRTVFNALIERLRNTFVLFTNAKIEVKEFEQGPPVAAPVVIRVLGENLAVLKQLAAQVETFIKETEGTININNPLSTSKIDLHLKINREKAAMLGLSLLEIDRTVRTGIAGLPVSYYRDREGKEYQIVLRLPKITGDRLEVLSKIFISSRSGKLVPLRQVAKLEFKASPMEISHYNLERSVSVTADVMHPFSVNTVTHLVIDKLNTISWPRGYRYTIGGELESREESFGGMYQAIIIAFIGIFAVLVLQFRSYLQPFIVFSAIPLAIIGSILALLITGNTFSFTAFIGFTSLVGIVINNSIILVDYTNQLRREGKDIVSALKEAGETRFLPIILTTATTIGGLLPLTLGGGTLWAPMGWTIIGGLTASTFLTLLVVPMLYLLLDKSVAVSVKKVIR